ncbi:GGDEF domain-containing protein [Humidesulfovibrio idahonensis]
MLAQIFSVDIRTVLFLLCLGNLASAGLLLTYNGRLRGGPGRLFALTKLLQGLAWPLLALRGNIPDVLSCGLGNVLLLLGFCLESACIRALDQPGRPLPKFWKSLLLASALGLSIPSLVPQANLRIAIGSAVAAVCFVLSGLRLLRGAKQPSPLRKTLGWTYLFLFAAVIWRAGLGLSDPTFTLFSPGLAASFSYLPLYLLMIAGSFGLLLLFKERDDQTLAHIATRDALTGAPNRRAVLEMATRLVARANREGKPLAVLMLDIDHFKLVNDTYGHAVGDAVLRDLSRVIAAGLRAYDAYGRFGGEEFVVVLPDTTLEDAQHVAERIRAAVEANCPQECKYTHYTVSIGLAWGLPAEADLDALLLLADQAMYEAKAQGRNRVVTSPRQQLGAQASGPQTSVPESSTSAPSTSAPSAAASADPVSAAQKPPQA